MKRDSSRQGRYLGRLLLLIYMACVVYFLFFSEMYGRVEGYSCYRYNLVLFREIGRFWTYRETLGPAAVAVNLLGNVAVFIPYGFALPLLFDRLKTGFCTVAVCFATSLVAETVQLAAKVGCFDVDDLFLNTLGGLAGFALYRIFIHIKEKKSGKEVV